MSWAKENLWALSTKGKYDDTRLRRSLFQQRWIAKREVRGYHVPNISEKQFIERHFNPKIKLQYLPKRWRAQVPPIAALAMADLERRVDVIVFRSHFATSIMHARKLVTSGYVKVNGEKVCTISFYVLLLIL